MAQKGKDGKKTVRRFICLLLALMLLPLGVLGESFIVEEEEEAAAPDIRRQARALMKRMTDEEKVYQLFFVTLEDLTQEAYTTKMPNRNVFARYPVGGVVIYGQNIVSEEQLAELTEQMQAQAKEAGAYGLLIGVHEGGGALSRVANKLGYDPLPGLGDVSDAGEARSAGERIAGYLAKLGINLNFAVSLDTVVENENGIGERSYGDDPDRVARLGLAFGEGLAAGGVIPCFGHFPNDGSLEKKKYDGSASNRRSLQDMRRHEWTPFMKAAQSADVMMTSFGILRAAGDDMPASLSRQVIDGLLRGELGFDGVVVTESLRMTSVTDYYKPGAAAVAAVQAGADMLFLSPDIQTAAVSILHALQDGTISRERLELSVERILALKIKWGLIR